MGTESGRSGIAQVTWLTHARAVLTFLLGFLIALRAASVYSWASAGTPLTTTGFLGAFLLAAILTGAWYAYQVGHQPSEVRPRLGRLVIARW